MALLKFGRSVRKTRKSGSPSAVIAAVLVTTGLMVVPGITASADPAPASASDAQTRLADLSRQSEETNEAFLNAQIDLDAKQQQVRDAQASEAVSRAALDAANATIAAVRPAVDKLANANYQGARTNRLFAVMVSTSPQQMLDQMSALDIISHETAQQVDQFQRASSDAAKSEAEAVAASSAAQQASQAAKAVSDDLQNKQSDLQAQIGQVIAAFGALTATEQSALAGTPMPPGFDPSTILKNLVPGSDASALVAGMTQIGKPYVWGATGPDSFDCSGLMVWAYKQIGKTLPRTSQAQAAGGTPVDQKDLRPGDLVLFYPDASHVGMYAGNGNVLHASTFGVPVKIQSMASFPYYGARRY